MEKKRLVLQIITWYNILNFVATKGVIVIKAQKGKVLPGQRRKNSGFTLSEEMIDKLDMLSQRAGESPGRLIERALNHDMAYLEEYVTTVEQLRKQFQPMERKIA